ncbi:MAG: hypothetical protein WCL28_00725 [bacterium]
MSGCGSYGIFLASSVTFGLLSCGSNSGGLSGAPADNGAAGGGSGQTHYTMSVNAEGDLPACSSSNKKQLIYVTSNQSFKSCEERGWTTIEIGGLRVLSNSLLSPHQGNLCTFYSTFNTCQFRGGQLVKYSDGSVLLTGLYTNKLVHEGSISSDPEYDQFNTTISFLIPASADYGYQILDEKVARVTGDFRNLFLVYVKSTDKVGLVFDSNGNELPDTTDEVVAYVARTNW